MTPLDRRKDREVMGMTRIACVSCDRGRGFEATDDGMQGGKRQKVGGKYQQLPCTSLGNHTKRATQLVATSSKVGRKSGGGQRANKTSNAEQNKTK